MNFDINDYEKDVQNYMLKEQDASKIPMYKDEIYINWSGKAFKVLEDAPEGSVYVKCSCRDRFGVYSGYRPKIVLVS